MRAWALRLGFWPHTHRRLAWPNPVPSLGVTAGPSFLALLARADGPHALTAGALNASAIDYELTTDLTAFSTPGKVLLHQFGSFVTTLLMPTTFSFPLIE